MSRRQFFGSTGVVLGGSLLAACRARQEVGVIFTPTMPVLPTVMATEPVIPVELVQVETVRPSLVPTEVGIDHEVLVGQATEFGFNTHVNIVSQAGENLTLEKFIQDMDLLVANGQEWVRFNVLDWEAVSERNLQGYDTAVRYAAEKGLKIALVTNVPGQAREQSREEYLQTTRDYYQALVTRWRGLVTTWQIFNETDSHHFRDYSLLQTLTDDYIAELAEVVGTAAEVIKAGDPATQTTVNIGKWVGANNHTRFLVGPGSTGERYAPVLESVDVITLDLYPDTNSAEIARLPEYVAYFADTYGKPVVIGELGLPEWGPFSQESQAWMLTQAVAALKGGRVQPAIVMVYELNDEALRADTVEGSFGLVDELGNPKRSFESVVGVMQPVENIP